MTINWNAEPADIDLIDAVAHRAYLLDASLERHSLSDRQPSDKMHWVMDLTATHLNGCPLKLADLAEADDVNFAHDAFGIARHLDRTTGRLTGCFLPRYAA